MSPARDGVRVWGQGGTLWAGESAERPHRGGRGAEEHLLSDVVRRRRKSEDPREPAGLTELELESRRTFRDYIDLEETLVMKIRNHRPVIEKAARTFTS